MDDRISEEIQLLKKYYPDLEYDVNNNCIKIPNYSIPKDMSWNMESVDICFFIPIGYPGSPPYGFFVSEGLNFNNQPLNNTNINPSIKPQFAGNWILVSWSHDNNWRPNADIRKGSNLLNFVRTFADRFKDGR